MNNSNHTKARVKPLKVFPAAPLNDYLALTPTESDIQNQLNAFNGNKNLKFNPHELISTSQHLNRLAERHLWLRRENYPLISYSAWHCILNANNGRSEFQLDQLGSGIGNVADEYDLDYDLINDLNNGEKKLSDLTCEIYKEYYEAVLELFALTPSQWLVIQEFIEVFWGRRPKGELSDDEFVIKPLNEQLAIFSSRPKEVVFAGDDPLDAWSFECEETTDKLDDSKVVIVLATNSNGTSLEYHIKQRQGEYHWFIERKKSSDKQTHWKSREDIQVEISNHIINLAAPIFK